MLHQVYVCAPSWGLHMVTLICCLGDPEALNSHSAVECKVRVDMQES